MIEVYGNFQHTFVYQNAKQDLPFHGISGGDTNFSGRGPDPSGVFPLFISLGHFDKRFLSAE